MTSSTVCRLIGVHFCFLVSGAMTGCAATQTLLSKRDLVVQAKTSTAIFVDPVPRAKRSIYLDVKSGVDGFDRRAFKTFVVQQFATNDQGFHVVDDPNVAQFTMVAYVMNLEQASPTAAAQALGEGYKGQAVHAAQVAESLAGGGSTGAAGGLAVEAAEQFGGVMVRDVTFMLVCDVQIRERAARHVIVHRTTRVDAQVSDSGTTRQEAAEATNRKEYRTRIVTTANKANLALADAQAEMFKKTAYAMSGFF